jgi:hypothetical protein
MIRVAARRADGTKLKMDAHVKSLGEAWDLLHSELRSKKIPTDQLVAIQLTTSRQAAGGLQVLREPPARKKRGRPPRVG